MRTLLQILLLVSHAISASASNECVAVINHFKAVEAQHATRLQLERARVAAASCSVRTAFEAIIPPRSFDALPEDGFSLAGVPLGVRDYLEGGAVAPADGFTVKEPPPWIDMKWRSTRTQIENLANAVAELRQTIERMDYEAWQTQNGLGGSGPLYLDVDEHRRRGQRHWEEISASLRSGRARVTVRDYLDEAEGPGENSASGVSKGDGSEVGFAPDVWLESFHRFRRSRASDPKSVEWLLNVLKSVHDLLSRYFLGKEFTVSGRDPATRQMMGGSPEMGAWLR